MTWAVVDAECPFRYFAVLDTPEAAQLEAELLSGLFDMPMMIEEVEEAQ